jgi:hypothetical protein
MKLLDHFDFWQGAITGQIELTNDQAADVFCSWKVGGQDFYAYGRFRKTEAKDKPNEQSE